MLTRWKIISTTTPIKTSVTGAFPDHPCESLEIDNNCGVDIEYQHNGKAESIPNGISRKITGISNANEISMNKKGVTAYAKNRI